VQGPQRRILEREIGDFVLLRADGQFAYQLAVVVDDAEQGVTDVVRGADLLDSTPRQIYLQRMLGYATPRYLHVPAAVNAPARSSPSRPARARWIGAQERRVARALRFLGQPRAMSSRRRSRTGIRRSSPHAASWPQHRKQRASTSASARVLGPGRPLAEEQHAAQHADHRDEQHADRKHRSPAPRWRS
jgi:hypothetical protein